mgnify:CR=1 FL=1
MSRGLLLLGLSAVLAGSAGCQLLAAPFLMWGPEPTKTVKAEYPHLQNKTVLVLVWAEPDALFDYPTLQYVLSEHLRVALEGNVSGVRCVPSRPVVEMQQRELDWDRRHPAEHGQRFKADQVLSIEINQFTTREPDSPHLLRGHVSANVKLYDPSYGTGVGPVWEPSGGAVRVVYPEDGPGAWGVAEPEIARELLTRFAQEVAGRFYDRKVKVK